MKLFRLQHLFFALLFPLVFIWLVPKFDSNSSLLSAAEKDKTVLIFEKKPCYGFCPDYKAQFFSNGKVEVKYTKPGQEPKTTAFRLKKEEVKSLVKRGEATGFFQMKDRYESLIPDFPARELTMFRNGKPKKVSYTEGGSPEFESYLKDLAQLVESNLNVNFGPPKQR